MSYRGVDPVRVTLGDGDTFLERVYLALRLKGAKVTRAEVENLHASGGIADCGDAALIERPIPDETDIDLDVVYADDDIVVVNKPAGIATTPQGRFVARSVLVQARRHIDPSLAPAHRLDRATSGILLLTRDTAHRGLIQAQFERRLVRKTYTFLSDSRVPSAQVESRIVQRGHRMVEEGGEPNSLTDIAYIGQAGHLFAYEARPLTGKTHQIRLHAASIGAPIAGDSLYGGDGTPPDAIALHSMVLEIDGHRFSAPPPWH